MYIFDLLQKRCYTVLPSNLFSSLHITYSHLLTSFSLLTSSLLLISSLRLTSYLLTPSLLLISSLRLTSSLITASLRLTSSFIIYLFSSDLRKHNKDCSRYKSSLSSSSTRWLVCVAPGTRLQWVHPGTIVASGQWQQTSPARCNTRFSFIK